MSRQLAITVLAAALLAGSGGPALAASSTPSAPSHTAAVVRARAPHRTPARRPAPAPAPSAKTVLKPGDVGPAVTTLQQQLGRAGYWVGTPTGHYGHSTAQAVMALQKVAGLSRDGVAGPATRKALQAGVRPTPRSTRGRVLEIDLTRQILMFSVDGKLAFVVNTSTGATATPTPRGRYTFTRQVDGWRQAPLGGLYRPKYFVGGYAVHGVRDGSIPGYAASHGCARVSMAAMDMMWGRGGPRIGDRVWVY